MHNKKGLLIALEGIDGCGKTTLAQNLSVALEKKEYTILLTREPGGSNLGQQLRTITQSQKEPLCAKAEYLLFAADRAHHFHDVILPALANNSIVISDRLADSSLAYQGYGRDLNRDLINTVNKWAMNNIEPDIVFYIRIDAPTALARMKKRLEPTTRFEQEKLDFWQKVITGYETIFKNKSNVVVLDGLLDQQDILEQALKNIKLFGIDPELS